MAKFRKDFVTNSSSSSFICEVCGREESGWDLGLSEADMMQCVNGHIFCRDEALELPSKEYMIKTILENEWNKRYNWRTSETNIIPEDELIEMKEWDLWSDFYTEGGYYDVDECVCPICQFTTYSNTDLIKYFLKEYNLIADEIVSSWKERFGTYDKFKKWLKE